MRKVAFVMIIFLLVMIFFLGFKIVDMKNKIKNVREDIEQLNKENHNLFLLNEQNKSPTNVDTAANINEEELTDIEDKDVIIIQEKNS